MLNSIIEGKNICNKKNFFYFYCRFIQRRLTAVKQEMDDEAIWWKSILVRIIMDEEISKQNNTRSFTG